MVTIWKYPLKPGMQNIEVQGKPVRILSAGLDLNGEPSVWILVRSSKGWPNRVTLYVAMTGEELDDFVAKYPWMFVATFQHQNLMCHLFVNQEAKPIYPERKPDESA